jgi:hypothetical protein
MAFTFFINTCDMVKKGMTCKTMMMSQVLGSQCKQGIIHLRTAGSEGWVCAARNQMIPTACEFKGTSFARLLKEKNFANSSYLSRHSQATFEM